MPGNLCLGLRDRVDPPSCASPQHLSVQFGEKSNPGLMRSASVLKPIAKSWTFLHRLPGASRYPTTRVTITRIMTRTSEQATHHHQRLTFTLEKQPGKSDEDNTPSTSSKKGPIILHVFLCALQAVHRRGRFAPQKLLKLLRRER